MTLVACGLLALGVLAFMISPMLEGSGRRPMVARSRRDDLLKKKDFIYSAIRELNIDFSMGKLAAEDHEALRQEYMKEASDVLDELDRSAATELPVASQIEEAVLDIRRSRGPAPAAEKTTEVDKKTDVIGQDEKDLDKITVDQKPPAPTTLACGSCGTVNEETANYCIECGASLKRSTCGECGTENPASAKFCAECGEKLT